VHWRGLARHSLPGSTMLLVLPQDAQAASYRLHGRQHHRKVPDMQYHAIPYAMVACAAGASGGHGCAHHARRARGRGAQLAACHAGACCQVRANDVHCAVTAFRRQVHGGLGSKPSSGCHHQIAVTWSPSPVLVPKGLSGGTIVSSASLLVGCLLCLPK
jgi:hypothetical protein